VENGISTKEEFSEMVNMIDQDTRTERKQIFDTQPGRRNRLFSSFSSTLPKISERVYITNHNR
jgi:hypothetical protein